MTDNCRIIYIGGFVDEAIVAERGLPSHNAAGSNRMGRISSALKTAGHQPVILSPAMSLRARFNGVFYHPVRIRHRGGASVIFAPAISIPWLNIFSSFFFQFSCLRDILKSRKIGGVIIYNFNPSLVLLCVYLKYIRRIPVLNNVEDVYIPSLNDWRNKSEARAVQEIVYNICMKTVAWLADGYIVPTKRFLEYLPKGKPYALVTGCILTNECSTPTPINERVIFTRVLFAGKIACEHGIVEFIHALKHLDIMSAPPHLLVDITGTGGMSGWVQEQTCTLRNIRVTFHGFLPSSDYIRILHEADICMALQNPTGRYANYKTPSKVYEFLGNGKAVIATNVGDFNNIPQGSILLLDRLEPGLIAEKLLWLCSDRNRILSLQFEALRYSKKHFSYAAVGEEIKALLINIKSR